MDVVQVRSGPIDTHFGLLTHQYYRVPQLDNGEAKLTRASFLGDGSDSMFLSRKGIAVWLLQEIEEGKWVRKAPLLSNPSFM